MAFSNNKSSNTLMVIFLIFFVIMVMLNIIFYFWYSSGTSISLAIFNIIIVLVFLLILGFYYFSGYSVSKKKENDDEKDGKIKSFLYKSSNIKDLLEYFKANVKEIEFDDPVRGKIHLELVSDGLYIDKNNMTSFYKCPGEDGKTCDKKFTDTFKKNKIEKLMKENEKRYDYLIPDYLKK